MGSVSRLHFEYGLQGRKVIANICVLAFIFFDIKLDSSGWAAGRFLPIHPLRAPNTRVVVKIPLVIAGRIRRNLQHPSCATRSVRPLLGNDFGARGGLPTPA